MSTIRQRVAIIGKDGTIRSDWVKRRRIRIENGHPWIKFGDALYDWSGPFYFFEYRLIRTFGARRYLGAQRIYLEGNPAQFRFDTDERFAILNNTGRALYQEADSDIPNRLLRPRRTDMVLVVLIGIVALAIGFVLGNQL